MNLPNMLVIRGLMSHVECDSGCSVARYFRRFSHIKNDVSVSPSPPVRRRASLLECGNDGWPRNPGSPPQKNSAEQGLVKRLLFYPLIHKIRLYLFLFQRQTQPAQVLYWDGSGLWICTKTNAPRCPLKGSGLSPIEFVSLQKLPPSRSTLSRLHLRPQQRERR
jgi:hypothetical protein